MNLAPLLLACSLHPDDALLTAIADAFSARNASAVVNVDVSILTGQDDPLSDLAPGTLEEALRAYPLVLQAGGEPVIGLLPTRLDWALPFGREPDELFEPCTNVEVASSKLSEFAYRCRHRGRAITSTARRACMLRRYARSVDLPALPAIVLAALEAPSPTDPADSGDFPAGSSIVPAGSGLFFSSSPEAGGGPLFDRGSSWKR